MFMVQVDFALNNLYDVYIFYYLDSFENIIHKQVKNASWCSIFAENVKKGALNLPIVANLMSIQYRDEYLLYWIVFFINLQDIHQ